MGGRAKANQSNSVGMSGNDKADIAATKVCALKKVACDMVVHLLRCFLSRGAPRLSSCLSDSAFLRSGARRMFLPFVYPGACYYDPRYLRGRFKFLTWHHLAHWMYFPGIPPRTRTSTSSRPRVLGFANAKIPSLPRVVTAFT